MSETCRVKTRVRSLCPADSLVGLSLGDTVRNCEKCQHYIFTTRDSFFGKNKEEREFGIRLCCIPEMY
jgi:hypothetical protein